MAIEEEYDTYVKDLRFSRNVLLCVSVLCLIVCLILLSMGRSDVKHKYKHTTTTLMSAMVPPTKPSEEALEDRYFTIRNNEVSRGTPRSTSTTRKVSVAKPANRTNKSGNHRGYATTRECIAAVEHGGSYSRSSNATHFGRYQFDRNSYAEFGGNPNEWGTASPEEQDRVFNNAMNAGAYSRWTPYDGCG